MYKTFAIPLVLLLTGTAACGGSSSSRPMDGGQDGAANGTGGGTSTGGNTTPSGSGGRGGSAGGNGQGGATGGAAGGSTGGAGGVTTGGRSGTGGTPAGSGGRGGGSGGGPAGSGGRSGGSGGSPGGSGGSGGSGGAGGSTENPSCVLSSMFTFGMTGGHVVYEDSVTLTPPTAYKHTRKYASTSTPDLTCAPALPACGSATAIDLGDINQALQDSSVQNALMMTTPPLFGRDNRPADGAVFSLLRADGRGFLVGDACNQGSGPCTEPPAGIVRLVADLRALDQQQLNDASCASLRSSQ